MGNTGDEQTLGIDAVFGGYPLNKITRDQISAWVQKMVSAGKKPSTIAWRDKLRPWGDGVYRIELLTVCGNPRRTTSLAAGVAASRPSHAWDGRPWVGAGWISA